MSEPQITTTETVFEDGNRATTICRDGAPFVIVTMGDDEGPEDYWESYSAAVAQAMVEAGDEPAGESAEAHRVP